MFVFVYTKPPSIGLESDQTKFFMTLRGYCLPFERRKTRVNVDYVRSSYCSRL